MPPHGLRPWGRADGARGGARRPCRGRGGEGVPRAASQPRDLGDEEEHSEEEHAEINEALLAFLQARGTDTQKYDDTLEELATAVNHHAGEEETTILNPARDEVTQERRTELGRVWLERRNELLEAGRASEEQVEALLDEAVDERCSLPRRRARRPRPSRRRPRRRRRRSRKRPRRTPAERRPASVRTGSDVVGTVAP